MFNVVLRSTCRSENGQSTSVSDRFLKLICQKSARRCRVKRVSQNGHTHTHHVQTIFGRYDVQTCAVLTVVARNTFRSQTCLQLMVSGHLWIFRCCQMWLCVAGTRDSAPHNTLHDPASLFSWQARYFRQMEVTNRKTQWYKVVSSALNFPCLNQKIAELLHFDVVNLSRKIVLFQVCRQTATQPARQPDR